jgi:cation transport ATPase
MSSLSTASLPAAQPATPQRQFFTRTTAIALFATLGIAAYLITRYLLHLPFHQCRWSLIAVLAAGGGPLVFDLTRKALTGDFGADLLAGISIVTSLVLGEYLAGSIVVLMLSGGTALEEYATLRASSVLGALARRMPRTAHRKQSEQLLDIDVSGIQLGERLVVFPHEICPADGVVVEGSGSMDESYLTGEPFLIQKVNGASVLSGALNGETVLTISVTSLPADSRYAKIMRVMREAETNRPQMRRIADRLGSWYTVVALAVAGTGWILGADPTRFLAVLVIATPCPLLLAIPIVIIGAISVAARRTASSMKLARWRPKVTSRAMVACRARSSAAARDAPTIRTSVAAGMPCRKAPATRRRSAAEGEEKVSSTMMDSSLMRKRAGGARGICPGV